MSLDVYLSIDVCPTCGNGEEVYTSNITHNLGKMAEEAGIYGVVWRPEENGIECAQQLIGPLRKALDEMRRDPDRYRKHDAPNGWGRYENFVSWLENYLDACAHTPTARVRVSR